MENKEIYGWIYLITNLINGKQYVGKTTMGLKKRFKCHYNDSKYKKTYIGRAINKYGKENFRIEVIAVAYTQEQLKFSEGFYIRSFNTLVPNGYNLTDIIDGKGKVSNETREKMKIANNTIKKLKISSDLGIKTRGIPRINSKSKYVGVCLIKHKYIAKIGFDKKRIHIGVFCNEIDAAKAYDIKAIELYGPDCNLNFPELRNDYISNKIVIKKSSRQDKSTSGEKFIYFSKRYNRWYYLFFDKITQKNKEKYFETLEEAINYKFKQ